MWIKLLIDLSSNRRSASPDLFNLFITTRGKVRAASRTVIAGWINTIFSDIGLNVSPGSTRAAVASYNYENNVALDNILQRGNWRGAENFFKHYCKIVEKQKTQATDSLFDLFEPL